jgi:prolyl-tRNA synthetase
MPGREGKRFVSQDGLAETVSDLLVEIQAALLENATRFQEEHTFEPTDYDGFKEAVKNGFARVWWAGDSDDELRVKEETKATIRCIPFEQPEGNGTCFLTGRPAEQVAVFARAY